MIIGINGKIGSGKDTVGSIIQYLTSESGDPNSSKHRSYEEFLSKGGGYAPRNFDHHYVSDWEIKKFAGKLKTTASLLTGIPVEKFEDQEFKKQEMSEEWWYKNVYDVGWDKKWTKETINYPTHTSTESHIVKTTYRQFLQNLGTEAMREGLHTNVWVNALFADYIHTKNCGCEKNCRCEHDLPNWIITDMRFPNEMEAIKEREGFTIRVVRPGTEVGTHPSETALDDKHFDYEIVNSGTIENLIDMVREILTREGIL